MSHAPEPSCNTISRSELGTIEKTRITGDRRWQVFHETIAVSQTVPLYPVGKRNRQPLLVHLAPCTHGLLAYSSISAQICSIPRYVKYDCDDIITVTKVMKKSNTNSNLFLKLLAQSVDFYVTVTVSVPL